MPNHVHFIMVPSREDVLSGTFDEAHPRYIGRINARWRQTGHLWQGRFSSAVMDERHLIAAALSFPRFGEIRVHDTGCTPLVRQRS